MTLLLPEYLPEIWQIRKDYIYDAEYCIRLGMENLILELHSVIEKAIYAGAIKDKSEADSLQYVRDIRGKIHKMKETLENLKTGKPL